MVSMLFHEDLHDVILVGHSYGGMVITGIADLAADRVGRIVYLDAANPVRSPTFSGPSPRPDDRCRRRVDAGKARQEATQTSPNHGLNWKLASGSSAARSRPCTRGSATSVYGVQ